MASRLFLSSFLCLCRSSGCFGMHPQQKVFRRDWRNDVIFLLLNGMLTKLGLLAVIVGIIFSAAWIVPASFQTLVGGLPYWVQIPAVIVLCRFGILIGPIACSMPFPGYGDSIPFTTAWRSLTGWPRAGAIRSIRF